MGEELLLDLQVDSGIEGGLQSWRIVCVGVCDYLLRCEYLASLELVEAHPVLLPFTEKFDSLYFTTASDNPMATAGALFQTHRRFVAGWIPFARFLNLGLELSALLTCSSGLLASGPVSLIQAYSRVLLDHGMRCSTVSTVTAQSRNRGGGTQTDKPLRALIFENSYIVAENFVEQRLNPLE
jgi:hypothetical protein